MAVRVVGYLRISSAEQVEGLSPETQRRALVRAGAVEIFEDLGISGFKDVRRAGFEALLEAINAGTVRTVVCNTYSRLSRNAKDSARLDDALLAAGAKVLDLGTGQHYEPADLTPELLALLARQESRSKSKRQHQAFNELRAAGKSVSPRAPWGLRLPTRASKLRGEDPTDAVERVITRDPVTFPLARRVVEHYLESGCEARSLLTWAQDNADCPFQASSSLRNWLDHPIVKEHVLRPGEAQQIASIKRRHTNGWRRGAHGEPSPYRGLVVCARCGNPMAAANRRQAMRCALDRCSNGKQVRLELVTWAASYALCKASKIASERLLDALEEKEPSAESKALQGQVDALEAAIKAAPVLEASLRGQIDGLLRQQASLDSKDLSQWRTLEAEWLQDLRPDEWLWIPDDLKPRVYRLLLRSISVDDGRVIGVQLRDGTKGLLPDVWPLINNRGVNWGPIYLCKKDPYTEVRKKNIELLNWRGLLEFKDLYVDQDQDSPPFWLKEKSKALV